MNGKKEAQDRALAMPYLVTITKNPKFTGEIEGDKMEPTTIGLRSIFLIGSCSADEDGPSDELCGFRHQISKDEIAELLSEMDDAAIIVELAQHKLTLKKLHDEYTARNVRDDLKSMLKDLLGGGFGGDDN